MGWKDSSKITPFEFIYRQIAQPIPPKEAPKPPDPPAPINLDDTGVSEIIKGKRAASIDELQWILEQHKQFNLSVRTRNDLSLRITIALAGRGRPQHSANAELFGLLDVAETPKGLLYHRSWFEREFRMGANSISNCKLHRPPRCRCWSVARQRLFLVQDKYGSNSPESWMAARLWEQFEELETASKQERVEEQDEAPLPTLE